MSEHDDTVDLDMQDIIDRKNVFIASLEAEVVELRAQLASAKAEVERLKKLLERVELSKDAEASSMLATYALMPEQMRQQVAPTPQAPQQEKHTTHPEGGSR